MELLNPVGLFWLAALPLLLVPYLIRERPRRRIVSAIFLYQGIESAKRLRLGPRPKVEPLFFLQCLLCLVAIAALARPALRSAALRSALVVDDSASLQAKDATGNSRFDLARQQSLAAVDRDPAEIWDVFRLSPQPQAIALGLTGAEARQTIRAIDRGSCPHPDEPALGAFLGNLARQGYSSIHLVTDRSARSAPPFEVVTVGEPAGNLAIIDFTLAAAGFAARKATANVTVGNYSARPARVTVSIENVKSGEKAASRELEVAPDRPSSFSASVPAGSAYRATIDAADALTLDNLALAAAPADRERSILVVSSTPSGLETIPGLHVETIPSYDPTSAMGRDLVIFHLAAPGEPPPNPTLYLLPPDAPFLPSVTATSREPALAFPLPTHPAVRYLNAGALRPRQSLVYRPPPGWQPLAVTTSGPVLLAHPGPNPAAVSGIDLLPYLGERNRPVSILTLNLLSWLAAAGEGHSVESQACLPLGASESDLRKTTEMKIPGTVPSRPEPKVVVRPLWPMLALAALALAGLEAWLQARSVRLRALTTSLRLAVAALLLVAAFDPERAVPGPMRDPSILVDASRSVPPQARARGIAGLGKIASPSATATVFATSSSPVLLADATGPPPAGLGEDATDLEAALLGVEGEASVDSPVLLVTDGWETRGHAERALDVLRKRRIRVYPIAVADTEAGNIEVERLSLPAESASGRPARAEVLLRNDNATVVSGRLWLRRGAETLSREAIKLIPGENLIVRPLLVTGSGLLEFSATFEAGESRENRFTDDDSAKAWVSVRSRREVLLIAQNREDNRYLDRALSARGFAVKTVAVGSGDAIPEPRSFGAIVLNDVALGDLPPSFPSVVRDYVRSGGGLAMVGGPRSFGLGGYLGSPVEDALPVRMKQRRRAEPRSSVALVIDKSGSMREERRMVYARDAARALAEHLNDHDRLAVIGFDREPFVVIPLSEVRDIREDFEDSIRRLKPVGGTRLYPALVEAERQLMEEEATRRHIIVLSDGLSEDAESAVGRRRYYDLALALAEKRVSVSTIALGRDADADFLERLASFGRGVFHETADPASLPELVLGELESQGKEKTLRESEIRPTPERDSPLVGEIARGEESWPAVLGLVETELKRGARLDVGSSAPDRPPLVASWEFGSGRAVAFTTDADGRWSDRWVRWREWSRLWAAIAGWLIPEREEQAASFAMAYQGGALTIDYTRYDDDPAGPVTASISGPGDVRGEVGTSRIAPGHYRGSFTTQTPGDYRIDLKGPRGSVTRPPLGFTLSPVVSAERARPEPNWTLLEEIARATGGKINPKPEEIPFPAPAAAHLPLAPWLIPAAILLFIAELIVRRLTGASSAPSVSEVAKSAA